MAPTRSNNPAGTNKQGASALERWPHLPDRIAHYVRMGLTEPRMIEQLKTEGINISGSTIDRVKRKFNIPSVRRNPMSDTEIAEATFRKLQQDDPRGAIGTVNLKHRLATEDGVFVSRGMLRHLQHNWDPVAQDKRNPKISNEVHKHGIWSAGPGEEWCFDQHEKLVPELNIGVLGGIDKYTREAFDYVAVSRWRQRDVGVAIYLRVVQKEGGFPVTTHTDMGAETTDMCRIQTALREKYNPVLDAENVPPHVFTTSKSNIIKEQKWKDIYRKDLANVLECFKRRPEGLVYNVGNPIHIALARWIWAKAVQLRLDLYVKSINSHTIRKNKKILLPTGVSPLEIKANPARFGGVNLLTPLPKEEIDRLVRDYVHPDIFQFGTDEEVRVYEHVFNAKDCPAIDWNNAWDIYSVMLPDVATYFL